MEFYTWPHAQTDVTSTEDLTPLWIPDTQSNTWQWDENCSISYIEHPHNQVYGDSAYNSPESLRSPDSFPNSSYAGSNFDGSADSMLDFEPRGDVKSGGRPRAPVASTRDPNENRIQRRRTQNRNSQRVYRQRRIEERNEFEARATTAEATSEELKIRVIKLETEIVDLTKVVDGLEVENAELRKGNKSRP